MFPAAPDPTHAEALAAFIALRAADTGLAVAYVTGRHLVSAVEAMAYWSLPKPDLLSCDVGTAVYLSDMTASSGWRRDEDYAVHMHEAMGGVTAHDIETLLDGVPNLVLQEADRQSEFKTSYTLPRDTSGAAAVTEVRRRLSTTGAGFSIVHSTGVYEDDDLLDILPPGVTKASAVAYMSVCATVASTFTLFAGDSRNDLDPLLASDGGIVVANARPALLDALRSAPESVYLAKQPHLYGVVEGTLYFSAKSRQSRTLKGDG